MGQPGEDDQFKPDANLSLLFARYHAKIIPWGGHKTAGFVALGFQDSDEDEDEDDHEE